MVYLKSCPKCLGDLTIAQDGYGTFISCLQCGFTKDMDVQGVPKVTAARFREEDRLAKAA